MNRIIKGNILSFARHYHGDPFHAIFCDPPYHLTSIVKRFGENEPEHTKTAHDIKNRSTPHARQAAGFMGKKWDGGDVAFKPKTWKALANLLYPGAFIFAFAGTRGYHRMAVAMEDAGLVIHPAIGWVFGSGFPKATRIDTQIDNELGAERKITGESKADPKRFKDWKEQDGNKRKTFGSNITEPYTDLAKQWEGHRYGLQTLKPAFEFIAVAQKPYIGRSVDCISKTGAGALNIEKSRIGTERIVTVSKGLASAAHEGWKRPWHENAEAQEFIANGRWPANFALCHSPECERECVEGCPAKMMDDQSGESSGSFRPPSARDRNNGIGLGNQDKRTGSSDAPDNFGDSGGASRFFFNADYMHERLEDSDPVMYQAKAGNSERNAGLINFDEKQSIGYSYSDQPNDPANGMFKDRETVRKNNHPTIKPISLCKWLSTLLLPPDSYSPRRLLIPFSGAGSEMIGATLAGWDQIIGVEMESEYASIARARLAWWEQKLTDGHTDLDRMLKQWNRESESEESDDEQLSLL